MVSVNILASALYPAYRLFDGWTEAKEIDTDAASQVRGSCERVLICIAFHLHMCVHMRTCCRR